MRFNGLCAMSVIVAFGAVEGASIDLAVSIFGAQCRWHRCSGAWRRPVFEDSDCAGSIFEALGDSTWTRFRTYFLQQINKISTVMRGVASDSSS